MQSFKSLAESLAAYMTPEPRAPESEAGGAASRTRPISGTPSETPAPYPSTAPPSHRAGRPSIAPRAWTDPPPSSMIPRPMTVPPLAAPPDEDDLDEEELLALAPSPTGRFGEELQAPPDGAEILVRGVPVRDLPKTALGGHTGLFAKGRGPDLLERPSEYYAWYETRSRAGLLPYSRSFDGPIGPMAPTRSEDGVVSEGLSFAANDYLALSTHPAVHEAAHQAIRDFGTIAGGSPILAGNTTLSRTLEEEVSKLVGMDHVVCFTSGWTAGFSAITALVREHDHIVMDVYSHACLQQGAAAATRKIARFRHRDNVSAERQIRKARDADPEGGILVITETLFSMDSDSPNIGELQDICHHYGATLLVDCAHDLGALGPGGTGRLGIENRLGTVDMLIGCFSKAFATSGGFVAVRHQKVRQYIRAFSGPYLFSTGLSPIQAAVALAALRVSASPEGDELRRRLMDASLTLRAELTARDLQCIGEPSALVPVMVGDEDVARVACAIAFERGLVCNLIEYPAVAVHMARFRLQLQSLHTREHAVLAARIVDESIQAAKQACGRTT